jgi:hypothetical protein
MIRWFHISALCRCQLFQWHQPLSFTSLQRHRSPLFAGEEMFQ